LLVEALILAAKHRQQQDPAAEPDSRIKVYFEAANPLMSTRAKGVFLQEAEDTGSGRQRGVHLARRLERHATQAASAVVEAAGSLWGRLLAQVRGKISEGAWRGVVLLVQRRYDETPLRLRLSSGCKDEQSVLRSFEMSTHAKMLQSELRVSMLVAQQEGSFLEITGRFPTALQILETNKGECLKEASLRHMKTVPGLAEITSDFKWVLQQATVDQFSANTRAERSLLHDDIDRETAAGNVCGASSKFTKFTQLVLT
jgi:hypothetical protein